MPMSSALRVEADASVPESSVPVKIMRMRSRENHID